MMKPILGANHRSTRIEITLPVDVSGEYAYDEDGKPIKGKVPVTITVPRYDCIPRPQMKQLTKDLAAIDDLKDEDGEPLTPQERGVAIALAMLRPFVSEDEYTVLGGLQLFELEQIAERIQEGSSISAGELRASTSS
jgi:hypothetical protein